MANYYYLMNKEEKVLLFREIQDRYGESFFENCERYHAPLPVSLQGIPNQHIGSWLQQRKVPSHRRHIKKLLHRNATAFFTESSIQMYGFHSPSVKGSGFPTVTKIGML